MERYFNYSHDYLGDGGIVGGATITIYDATTLNLATIYSDELLTPKSNPFVSDADGFFYFYAAGGRYDVSFSGTGITSPFTWSDLQLIDTYAIAKLSGGNAFSGNQTITGNLTVTGSGTFGGNALINSSGKITGIVAANFSSLDGSAITGLNATQLGSGTVPSAVLSGTYGEALTFDNAANIFSGSYVELGAAPASSGAVRLSYNESIVSMNSVGVPVALAKLGTSDTLELAEATVHSLYNFTDVTYDIGTLTERFRQLFVRDVYTSLAVFASSAVATAGAIRLGNDTGFAITWRNAADTANHRFYLDSADVFQLESEVEIHGDIKPDTPNTRNLGSSVNKYANAYFNGGVYSTDVIVAHAGSLQGTTLAGVAFDILSVNASDQIVIGDGTAALKINKAGIVASGGSNTVDLSGNIIGVASGPATRAPWGWIPFVNSAGDAVWLLAWK